MLIPHTKGNISYMAVAFPPIYDMDTVKDLRDALMETLEICVSYPEAKEASKPYHLYLLSCMIKELNKDIEEQKGGNV